MPKKPTPGGLVQVNVRLAPWVVDAFDTLVEKDMTEHPGRLVTRADRMREVLTQYAEEHRTPKPQGKRSRS